VKIVTVAVLWAMAGSAVSNISAQIISRPGRNPVENLVRVAAAEALGPGWRFTVDNNAILRI
jgi:hypothetical protein